MDLGRRFNNQSQGPTLENSLGGKMLIGVEKYMPEGGGGRVAIWKHWPMFNPLQPLEVIDLSHFLRFILCKLFHFFVCQLGIIIVIGSVKSK